MTLASAEACFHPDVATYLYNCYILSVEYVASLALPDVKNTSSYPLVGARNVFFVVVGALFAGPDFFQGFFPLFVILNTLDFIGIMLMKTFPCSSTFLVYGM